MATVKKPFLKMQCSICKSINYFTRKTKKVGDKKLELKKHCKVCRKHTLHKEGKK
ncbi:MAG: 50S ribosomal protein L33 [Parcubacteria group bacterium]